MNIDSFSQNVLSIAGSDPSGGAGIQADLKTFAALGCYGMAAVTALTAQNTCGVSAIHLPPSDFVGEEIAMIFADIAVHAVKIGMLGSPAIVETVARVLAASPRVPIVLDPVLVATSGATLGSDAVIAAMRQHLFPLATIVTPNLAEAGRLAACAPPRGRLETETVAASLAAGGTAAWLIKGGHAEADTADDLLLADGVPHWLSAPRIATRNTHGTGCTLSSAIAAHLAKGLPLRAAVTEAKAYLSAALAGADALQVGHGHGPLDHFAAFRR